MHNPIDIETELGYTRTVRDALDAFAVNYIAASEEFEKRRAAFEGSYEIKDGDLIGRNGESFRSFAEFERGQFAEQMRRVADTFTTDPNTSQMLYISADDPGQKNIVGERRSYVYLFSRDITNPSVIRYLSFEAPPDVAGLADLGKRLDPNCKVVSYEGEKPIFSLISIHQEQNRISSDDILKSVSSAASNSKHPTFNAPDYVQRVVYYFENRSAILAAEDRSIARVKEELKTKFEATHSKRSVENEMAHRLDALNRRISRGGETAKSMLMEDRPMVARLRAEERIAKRGSIRILPGLKSTFANSLFKSSKSSLREPISSSLKVKTNPNSLSTKFPRKISDGTLTSMSPKPVLRTDRRAAGTNPKGPILSVHTPESKKGLRPEPSSLAQGGKSVNARDVVSKPKTLDSFEQARREKSLNSPHRGVAKIPSHKVLTEKILLREESGARPQFPKRTEIDSKISKTLQAERTTSLRLKSPEGRSPTRPITKQHRHRDNPSALHSRRFAKLLSQTELLIERGIIRKSALLLKLEQIKRNPPSRKKSNTKRIYEGFKEQKLIKVSQLIRRPTFQTYSPIEKIRALKQKFDRIMIRALKNDIDAGLKVLGILRLSRRILEAKFHNVGANSRNDKIKATFTLESLKRLLHEARSAITNNTKLTKPIPRHSSLFKLTGLRKSSKPFAEASLLLNRLLRFMEESLRQVEEREDEEFSELSNTHEMAKNSTDESDRSLREKESEQDEQEPETDEAEVRMPQTMTIPLENKPIWFLKTAIAVAEETTS